MAECRCRGRLFQPSYTWSFKHLAGPAETQPKGRFIWSHGAMLAEFSNTVLCWDHGNPSEASAAELLACLR